MNEHIYQYKPTVWIDSDNQDAVFVQSRSLPRRKLVVPQGREPASPLELEYHYNEEDSNYFYTYEYGFINAGNRFIGNEKYVKALIQRKEYPYLEVEQVLYRPNRQPNHFNMSVALRENGNILPFLSCRYIGSRYAAEKILKFPCKIVTPIDDAFDCQVEDKHSGVVYQGQSYLQTEHIKAAIQRGEEQLYFIYASELGSYTLTVPTNLDEELTSALFDYFEKPTLPEMVDGNITPESLSFYVDLKGR